jgi:hypothetical protein
MNRSEHELELMRRYSDGVASLEETQELEALIVKDAGVRQDFLRYTHLDSALAGVRSSQPSVVAPCRSVWLSWRPLTAAAAGLMIGLFSASLVLAVTSPKVTSERLLSLVNGSFDDNQIKRGFPKQTGFWSGDEAVVKNGRLQFVAPDSFGAIPGALATSCDVFQLVDLRPLRATLSMKGDSVLDLSACFTDSRQPDTNPSVTLFCQLYLFSGDPASLHSKWPQCIPDALAIRNAKVTTLGTDAKGSRVLTARCLVPAETDFAVVQISARPNQHLDQLDGLFVDDAILTLKTSPELPIRIVQR